MGLASFKKGYYQCGCCYLPILLPQFISHFPATVLLSLLSLFFPSLKQPHIELMQSKPTDAVRVGVCGHIFPVSRASDHGR